MTHEQAVEIRVHLPWLMYRYAILACLGVASYFAGLAAFNLVMPARYWFHYDRIEVVEPVVEGRPITFVSFVENRPVDLYFNDVLFCDKQDGVGMRNYASQSPELRHITRRKVEPRKWTFKPLAPVAGSECFLQSTITTVLWPGIKKQQTVATLPFVVQRAR